MSKYYVPKLEDFYTGLKYEYYDEILNEWVSQEFTENRIIREIDLALKSSEETIEEFLSRAYKNNLGKLVECKNIKTVDWLQNVKYRVKMSENKYYTPKIEEFCKNFEYEYNVTVHYSVTDIKQEYKPSVFGSLDNVDSLLTAQAIKEKTTIFDIIEENINKTRVKCLDAEDIESFGFERVISTEEGWLHVFENKISLQLQYLSKNNNKNIIQITQVMFDEPSFMVFWGTIKNKSELKRILEQVGVLKDE